VIAHRAKERRLLDRGQNLHLLVGGQGGEGSAVGMAGKFRQALGIDILLVLSKSHQRRVDEIDHLGFARAGRVGGGINLGRHGVHFARLLAGE